MNSDIISLIISGLGNDFTLEIKQSSTVKELKQKIVDEINEYHSIEDYMIELESEPLKDYVVLSTLSIEKNAIIQVKRKNKGGTVDSSFRYLDVSTAKLVKCKVGNYGNPHLRVIPGLNLECKCIYEKCDYYDQEIICPVGEVTYNFLDQKKNLKNTKCPICHNTASFENCGFYKCKYLFIGTKFDLKTNQTKPVDVTRHTSNGEYECFQEVAEDENVSWINLKVEIDTH